MINVNKLDEVKSVQNIIYSMMDEGVFSKDTLSIFEHLHKNGMLVLFGAIPDNPPLWSHRTRWFDNIEQARNQILQQAIKLDATKVFIYTSEHWLDNSIKVRYDLYVNDMSLALNSCGYYPDDKDIQASSVYTGNSYDVVKLAYNNILKLNK